MPLPCSPCTYNLPASNWVIPLMAEALTPIAAEFWLLEKNSESRIRPFALLMPRERRFMYSRVLHQKRRIRRSGSDGTSTPAGAVGTTNVDPRYGDVGAKGAQQGVRAVALQEDFGGRLRGPTDMKCTFPARL